MKKIFIFLFTYFYQHCRQQQFRAAVKHLPVYEIERLAYTDFANVPPRNFQRRKSCAARLICKKIRRQIRKLPALN